MDTGFFTMDDVTAISKMSDLQKAKQHATSIVDNFIAAHQQVHKDNVQKVTAMIAKARSVNQLMFSMSNLVLAHPSEGLKVAK